MNEEEKHIQLNKAKWDKWADAVDSSGWRYDYLRKAQRSVISLLTLKESVHFLDVGCGTGWAIGEAAALIDGNGLFYGVDISEKMIEKAKAKFHGRENFHFIQANAEAVPLDGDFFDIIICTNSFHHYLHPSKVLNEIFRLLKKGGQVYILDPTADTWIIKVADRIIRLLEPEHVKIYSTKQFQQLFHDAGLQYVASQIVQKHQKVHIGRK